MGTTDPSHYLNDAAKAVQERFQGLTNRFKTVSNRLPAIRNWLIVAAPPDAVLPEAVPFQGEIEQLLAEAPPRILMSTYYLLLALFICILVITSFAQVDVIISGTGRLSTSSPPMMIQPLDRAIVKEIKVRTGDIVHKGQVLATMDPTFSEADLQSLEIQQRSLDAQVRRLEAELDVKVFEAPANASLEERLQANLYRQHIAQYRSHLRSLDEDISRDIAGIRSAEADHSMLVKQLSVAQDVENTRSNLLESRTGTRLQYLDAQSSRMRAEKDLADTANRMVELQHTVESLRAQRQSYIDDWNRQLLEELSRARGELGKVTESLTKATRMHSLVDLTSPADGVVSDVSKRSAGAIISGGETVLTVMPSDVPLIGEISITSGDVGQVKLGSEVQLKVDSFPYQRFGRLFGKLDAISQDSFQGGSPADQKAGMGFSETSTIAGAAVYKARIALETQTLPNLPEGAHLMPGMTVAAEIKVGTRSIISYFFNPITRGLSESVREP